MDFKNVKVVGREVNYHKRLFLEAWHSTTDPDAGNDHIIIPETYKCMHRTSVSDSQNNVLAQASRYVYSDNV